MVFNLVSAGSELLQRRRVGADEVSAGTPLKHFDLARSCAALVLAACFYSLVLCWLFSRGLPVTNTIVAVADGAIVLSALGVVMISRPMALAIVLTGLALNFALIALISQNLDLKSLRDPLAIIAFLGLGLFFGNMRHAQRVFFAIAASVIGFGVFELLAPRLYATTFNVLQFYIMRGLVDPSASAWVDNSLFVSSIRGGARNLLPMLGPHRVSSIFLEPVSMGNFGAIAIAWALSLGRGARRAALAAGGVGAAAIVMADARFAVVASFSFVCARFVPLAWTRLVLAPLPIIALAVLICCSTWFAPTGDDLPSRLSISGTAIRSLSPAEIFGLAPGGAATLDSGYAYVLTAFGLPLCIGLWAVFVWLPTTSVASTRFKLLVGFYICTLLCVSGSSLFALKTAALLWFLMGSMMAEERVTLMAIPARLPRAHALQHATAK